ncbi:hypothetical protein [Sphingomicrobium nitratireducens]|uniref:hypothetical protein n=1 Tax=Sphingomicrobium nitratireducens TaxID=2964666 RepID=UPI00223F8E12|nr:hypothetical protein [Sphingomicrobium nitratireducens]
MSMNDRAWVGGMALLAGFSAAMALMMGVPKADERLAARTTAAMTGDTLPR